MLLPHYLIRCCRKLGLRRHLLLEITVCLCVDIAYLEFCWAKLCIVLDSTLLTFELLPSWGRRVWAATSNTAAWSCSMVDRRVVLFTSWRETLLPTMNLLSIISLRFFWLLLNKICTSEIVISSRALLGCRRGRMIPVAYRRLWRLLLVS